MTETFDADWLALREAFDAVARSRKLAERFAAALPQRPRITDLGAGTGSLFRWLAPIIGRAQVWTFVDSDGDLLDRAFIDCAAWGRALGFAVTFPPGARHRAMLLHSGRGAWRIEAARANLADPAPPLHGADGVVCSALLDLVSRAWLERLCEALTVPLLACLSVDGRDVFRPPHAADAIVRSGFRRDQQRDKGLGPALGPAAPSALHRLLVARGFSLASAPSDWCITVDGLPMLEALLRSHARVATHRLPWQRGVIAAWTAARLRQARAGKLAIRIGHRDSLALPPG